MENGGKLPALMVDLCGRCSYRKQLSEANGKLEAGNESDGTHVDAEALSEATGNLEAGNESNGTHVDAEAVSEANIGKLEAGNESNGISVGTCGFSGAAGAAELWNTMVIPMKMRSKRAIGNAKPPLGLFWPWDFSMHECLETIDHHNSKIL